MVRVTKIQKIEFWISKFILSYTGFKLWAISCNKTCSFVNNICEKKLRKPKNLQLRRQLNYVQGGNYGKRPLPY